MQYDVMKEMLQSTVIVNYIQPGASRGINRISEGPSQVVRPTSRLSSYAGTPYDFENPSCGS